MRDQSINLDEEEDSIFAFFPFLASSLILFFLFFPVWLLVCSVSIRRMMW